MARLIFATSHFFVPLPLLACSKIKLVLMILEFASSDSTFELKFSKLDLESEFDLFELLIMLGLYSFFFIFIFFCFTGGCRSDLLRFRSADQLCSFLFIIDTDFYLKMKMNGKFKMLFDQSVFSLFACVRNAVVTITYFSAR